jgi:hypothetical protein
VLGISNVIAAIVVQQELRNWVLAWDVAGIHGNEAPPGPHDPAGEL